MWKSPFCLAVLKKEKNISKFVTVILPLAVPKTYSYSVPDVLIDSIQWGVRVEVPLRNKVYSAIVVEILDELEVGYRTKEIISVIDQIPIITKHQYNMWVWMSHYYCCTIGEVMNVALPSGLKLQSETRVVYNYQGSELPIDLEDDAYLIAEALQIKQVLTINEIRLILDKKTIYPVIFRLLEERILYINEELIQKFKPKTINFVQLTDYYLKEKNRLTEAMDLVSRSKKQTDVLLAFMDISIEDQAVEASMLYKQVGINKSILNAMEKKGIFSIFKKEVSRINLAYDNQEEISTLSEEQAAANILIQDAFENKKPVLLHGVTGSGKTRIYIEWIKKAIDNEEQCLYLLPEIALTTQIVGRLRKIFGDDIGVYHSRMSQNERVELWKSSLLNKKKIILGARSSLFLPFNNLKLIIVDEEHDPSFKQADPSPRYNGRDVAVYMAYKYKADIILGSATPSLESYYNAKSGKYTMVEMHQRYSKIALPKTNVIDLARAHNKKIITNHFTDEVIHQIQTELDKHNQILIFQNRRGYTPILSCKTCGWVSECKYCDVSLTYHKYSNEQRCHYCGFRAAIPTVCPECDSNEIDQKGLGTEKIQQDVEEFFPFANIARLDYDTAKSKADFESILYDFEQKKIDILIGTQMITKGLDFDNISLVIILNADLMLRYPDFRANERAFQLFTQVSGRAGRRETQGQVAIQTYSPKSLVIRDTINNDYISFFNREIQERKEFYYPPIYKLINIIIKHKNAFTNNDAAKIYAEMIQKQLGSRVLGPATPGISRVRGLYIQNIVVKMEKDPKSISRIKKLLLETKEKVRSLPGLKSIRINIDVDPY